MQLVGELVGVTGHIHMRNMTLHTNDACSYIYIYVHYIMLHICMQLVSELVGVTLHIYVRNMAYYTHDTYSYINTYNTHYVAHLYAISEWISECDMAHSCAKHGSSYP